MPPLPSRSGRRSDRVVCQSQSFSGRRAATVAAVRRERAGTHWGRTCSVRLRRYPMPDARPALRGRTTSRRAPRCDPARPPLRSVPGRPRLPWTATFSVAPTSASRCLRSGSIDSSMGFARSFSVRRTPLNSSPISRLSFAWPRRKGSGAHSASHTSCSSSSSARRAFVAAP